MNNVEIHTYSDTSTWEFRFCLFSALCDSCSLRAKKKSIVIFNNKRRSNEEKCDECRHSSSVIINTFLVLLMLCIKSFGRRDGCPSWFNIFHCAVDVRRAKWNCPLRVITTEKKKKFTDSLKCDSGFFGHLAYNCYGVATLLAQIFVRLVLVFFFGRYRLMTTI